MSPLLKRLSTIGAAGGAALVLLAGPAGASPAASLSSGAETAAPAGASSAASVTDETAGPATTGSAAASVSFRVFGGRCFANDVHFQATTAESGFSGVQRFQQRAQLQKFTNAGWVNATGVSTATSARFPNDGRNFFFTRTWDGRHPVNGGSWRVKWQGVYFNGFGGVIAQTRVVLVTCL